MNREEILSRLKSKISDKRFEHSMGVEYTAACMAMVHGADVKKARLAGILHDCAKGIPTDKKLAKAEKHNIPINKSEASNPDLLHAKLGAYYAKTKYGVVDEDVLSAIMYHTTGKPDMTLLEKIIFVADYIEPNRKMINELTEIRREALLDLDKCVVHILKNTIEYLVDNNTLMDPMTEDTYNFYVKNIKESK